MNHAYRVVWNEALNVWMAVAEISRRKGKTKASVLLSGVLLGASPAGAVEETFTAASGNWSVDGNWADGSAPELGEDLQLNFEYVDYDNGYESTHDLGDLTVNKLSFSTSNPVFPFIDVDAASVDDKLTFTGGNATIDMSSPSDASFEVYINPEVVLASTLRVAGSDSTSNNTVLVTGGISGVGGLRVSEGVTVQLAASGGGLYTGDTTIEAGGILVNAWRTPSALSAASRHIVNGELRLRESGAIGGLEGSGQVTIDNGISLEVRALNTDSVFSGVISDYSGSGSLNKTGNGTLTLTGANTYTGGTTISNGTLAVRNGGSISHGATGLTVGDVAGQAGVLEIGAGSSVTSHRSYIGNTGVVRVGGSDARWEVMDGLYIGQDSEGTLELHDGGEVDITGELYVGSNAPGVASQIIVDGSGSVLRGEELRLGNSDTLTLANGGSASLNDGSGEVRVEGNWSTSGTLNFGTYNLGEATTAGVLQAGGIKAVYGLSTLNFNQTDTLNLEADILEYTGTASVNQRGIGTTILTGTNTYTGETRISNGTLSVQDGGSISHGGAGVAVRGRYRQPDRHPGDRGGQFGNQSPVSYWQRRYRGGSCRWQWRTMASDRAPLCGIFKRGHPGTPRWG